LDFFNFSVFSIFRLRFDPLRNMGRVFARTPGVSIMFSAIRSVRPCPPAYLVRRDASAFAAICCTDPELRPLVQAEVHCRLQDFLTQHPKALVELPRDHGKTMQVCARILWELGRNPTLRIKIVCATEAIAAERGRFLRQAIESNPRIHMAFPHLRPGEPWGQTHFSIERPANIIGPSVTALGVGAGLTGTRADLLVCDDIVDVKSLTSAAERERVKAFFRDNLMNLLEPDGRCWCLFTPWHTNDLNAELKRSRAFALFREAVGDDLSPVWPERWPRERLLERRAEIGAASFARGYRLVPLTEEAMTIRPEWVRFWQDDLCSGSRQTSDADAERKSGEFRYEDRDAPRIVLAIDPAVSARPDADASALVVLSRGLAGPVRCLEAIARRLPMPELVQLIDALDRRWKPEAILFESNAAFKGVKDLLVRHAGFGPKVRGIQQTQNKSARIEAFSVSVQNGSFLLRGTAGGVDASQQALFDEMTTFPAGEHDDLVDAAAMGTEYLLATREPRVW
jgi:predicted phage terminase large subunit-like protein